MAPPSTQPALEDLAWELTGRGRGNSGGKYLELITLCLGGQQGEGDAVVSLKNAALMLHYVLEQDAASLWVPAIGTTLMAYVVPQSRCFMLT